MSGPNILNLCYNTGAKREAKKKHRNEARYHVLEGEDSSRKSDSVFSESDEDSDSNTQRSSKKLAMFNKIFKIKAKNSDDEDGPSSAYELAETKEIADVESLHDEVAFKPEGTGMVNRKKHRLALYDSKYNQPKKHPGWAKIRPAPDIPIKITTNAANIVADFSSLSTDTMEEKPVTVQPLNQEPDLKEFDPLWHSGGKSEDFEENLQSLQISILPPINKINEKTIHEEKLAAIELPDLKIAKIEALKAHDQCEAEQVLEKSTDNKNDKPLEKANISCESFDRGLNKSVLSDNINHCKKGDVRIVASQGKVLGAVAFSSDIVSESNEELQAISDKSCNNSNPKLTDEEERAKNKIIADFFSEHTRSFTDADIDNFQANIAISKIEIYAEDIKRYHDSLKYHRGPVEHDQIYSLVETALKFIEDIAQKREKKKKGKFFPEFIERCLKSKAKKEAEAQKKKDQKKIKDNSRPKLWLVYNPYQKEKIIICTPGDFYDSE